ncbi:hypothetical protein ACYZT9_15060 [Pseudomonas sp. ZT5P21]
MTNEIRSSANPSSWDDVKLFVNDTEGPIDAPLHLRSGQTTIVELRSESLNGREVTLYNADNNDELVEPDPAYRTSVKFIDGIAKWTIKQDDPVSGQLNWVVVSKDISLPMVLKSYVLPSNIDQQVEVLLNGDPIPPAGKDFIGGRTIKLSLRYLNGEVLKGFPLALGVVPDAPLVPDDIPSEPEHGELTVEHEWDLIIPEKVGSFKLKLYSRHATTSLQTPTICIRGELERVDFKFLKSYDSDEAEILPVPPDELLWPDKTLIMGCGAIIKDSRGVPLSDVTITVQQPDIENMVWKTKSTGRTVIFLVNDRPDVGRTYEVVGVASLPDGERTIKLLVRATGG